MNKRNLFILACTSIYFLSCSKNGVTPSGVASFNFVNAAAGTAPLVAKFNNAALVYANLSGNNKINYGASNIFSRAAGNIAVALVQSTDTTNTLFQGTLNLLPGNIYSFFLTGTAQHPDTLFVQDQLPYHSATDSVAGIRFVNLSPGSSPMSVNIQGQANGSEVQSLSYKGITGFKSYRADYTVNSYVFEFRDVSSGTLLASYTLPGVNNATGPNSTTTNTVRFRNMTIALIGLPAGGTAPQAALFIPNY